MRCLKFIILVILCTLMAGFTPIRKKDHWKQLFNSKDLSGWDSYIGPDLDDHGKPLTEKPIGLNNDPRHVFSVVKDNGENVIRISGENWGAISTKKEFENYHLQLKFKWGALTWGRIQLKSEGAEVFYKQIEIEPIEQLPTAVIKQF